MGRHALYPKNDAPALDPALFLRPTAEYRGAPFWAWNTRLDRDQLLRQIDTFRSMGFGGFHIHARTGLATPYLGDEFMAHVRACAEYARCHGMSAWLYDEDRYPSGFAGGLVTREARYRARYLRLVCLPADHDHLQPDRTPEDGPLPARYQVLLCDGTLVRYRRLAPGELPPPHGQVWQASLETVPEEPWYNGQTYVDTLNKEAIERFLELTHERYAAVVGDLFGATIPAIFTDEPQFLHPRYPTHADDTSDITLPFTTTFFDTYYAAYGQRLEDHLPEVIWDLPDGHASSTRYRYYDHLSERFCRAFVDTVGAWCAMHGLVLTGHLMDEATLSSQTGAAGEAMRGYRGFGLPGIDVLSDQREYTTAKQVQSVARQYGRPGVTSELYGCTGWDFDFAGHKSQGDWQVALGIIVRVPHLAWLSMAGDGKPDYPAGIGYQSPWHREYPLVEDHFARLNTALTRGTPLVRVGVIHPIESYWLLCGPEEQTAPARHVLEAAFADLTEWLLFGLIDFIAESSLSPAQDTAYLEVGEMRYDAIVVPNLRTIRAATLDRLERFQAAGGLVIVAGEAPSYLDAVPSDRPWRFAEHYRRIALDREALLATLAPFRDLSAQLADGTRCDALLHQQRIDADGRWLFLCNAQRIEPCHDARISVPRRWMITHMDTLTGRQQPLAATHVAGNTQIRWDFPAHGSLLLRLDRVSSGREAEAPSPQPSGTRLRRCEIIAGPVPISLSEPNVLLLDQAGYSLDGEAWQGDEEILRIGAFARPRFDLPAAGMLGAQPWTDAGIPEPVHEVRLCFTIRCDTHVPHPSLALEDSVGTRIELDGQVLTLPVAGWFVDEAIRSIALPALQPGTHQLTLTQRIGRHISLEWCYLLGDFGVVIEGRHARISAAGASPDLWRLDRAGPTILRWERYLSLRHRGQRRRAHPAGVRIQGATAVGRPRRDPRGENRLRPVQPGARRCVPRLARAGDHRLRQPRQRFRPAPSHRSSPTMVRPTGVAYAG